MRSRRGFGTPGHCPPPTLTSTPGHCPPPPSHQQRTLEILHPPPPLLLPPSPAAHSSAPPPAPPTASGPPGTQPPAPAVHRRGSEPRRGGPDVARLAGPWLGPPPRRGWEGSREAWCGRPDVARLARPWLNPVPHPPHPPSPTPPTCVSTLMACRRMNTSRSRPSSETRPRSSPHSPCSISRSAAADDPSDTTAARASVESCAAASASHRDRSSAVTCGGICSGGGYGSRSVHGSIY